MSAWSKWKNSLGDSRPWHLLNPAERAVDSEISDYRYSICKQCPELISITSQCKRCGCFMLAKTKLLNASCPIGKW